MPVGGDGVAKCRVLAAAHAVLQVSALEAVAAAAIVDAGVVETCIVVKGKSDEI